MTLYAYRAVSKDGTVHKGVLENTSHHDIASTLQGKGLDLIHASPVRSFSIPLFRQKITPDDLVEFCIHLEQMEKTSVPLLESLQTLRIAHPRLRPLLTQLIQDMESGRLFSQALAKHPRVFDDVFVGFIEVGENTGQLASCLAKIQDHLLWLQSLKDQIQKATRYPLMMVTLLTFSLATLMTVMVPQLVELTQSLGQNLPWSTQYLYTVSLFLQSYGEWVMGTGVLLMVLGKMGCKHIPSLSLTLNTLSFHLPLIGPLQRHLVFARFCHYLGHMCSHDVNLLKALEAATKISQAPALRPQFQRLMDHVMNGSPLSQAFQATRLFPDFVIRMITIGEESGQLATTLGHVKIHFDRKVKLQLERFMTYMEPTLILITGLFLILIVYSVFWPLYDTLTMVDL